MAVKMKDENVILRQNLKQLGDNAQLLYARMTYQSAYIENLEKQHGEEQLVSAKEKQQLIKKMKDLEARRSCQTAVEAHTVDELRLKLASNASTIKQLTISRDQSNQTVKELQQIVDTLNSRNRSLEISAVDVNQLLSKLEQRDDKVKELDDEVKELAQVVETLNNQLRLLEIEKFNLNERLALNGNGSENQLNSNITVKKLFSETINEITSVTCGENFSQEAIEKLTELLDTVKSQFQQLNCQKVSEPCVESELPNIVPTDSSSASNTSASDGDATLCAQKIDNLEKKCLNLTEAQTQLEKQIEEKAEQLRQMRKQLKESQTLAEERIQMIETLEIMVANKSDEIAENDAIMSQKEEFQTCLQEALKQKESQIEEFQKQLEESKKLIDDQRQVNERYIEEIAQLNAKVDEKEALLGQKNVEIEALQNEIETVGSENQNSGEDSDDDSLIRDAEVNSKDIMIKDLEEQLAESENQYKKLLNQKDEVLEKLEEDNAIKEKDRDSLKHHVEQLEVYLTSQKESGEKLSNDYLEVCEKLKDVNLLLHEREPKIVSLRLQEELKQKEYELEEYKKLLEESKKMIDDQCQVKESYIEDIAQLNAKVNEKETLLRQRVVEIEALQEEIVAIKSEIRNSEADMENDALIREAEANSAEIRMKDLERQLAESENRSTELKQRGEVLEKEICKLEEEKAIKEKNIDLLQHSVEQLEASLTSQRESAEKLSNDYLEVCKNLKEVNLLLQEKESKITSLEKSTGDVLENYQLTKTSLDRKCKEIEELQQKYNKLNLEAIEESDVFRKEIEELNISLQNFTVNNNNLTATATETQEELQKAYEYNMTVQNEIGQQNISLQSVSEKNQNLTATIKELEEKLRQAQVTIDQLLKEKRNGFSETAELTMTEKRCGSYNKCLDTFIKLIKAQEEENAKLKERVDKLEEELNNNDTALVDLKISKLELRLKADEVQSLKAEVDDYENKLKICQTCDKCAEIKSYAVQTRSSGKRKFSDSNIISNKLKDVKIANLAKALEEGKEGLAAIGRKFRRVSAQNESLKTQIKYIKQTGQSDDCNLSELAKECQNFLKQLPLQILRGNCNAECSTSHSDF